MTDAVHELVDKSERSINAANLLLRDGYYDFAASRAYYAMFYAVGINGDGSIFPSGKIEPSPFIPLIASLDRLEVDNCELSGWSHAAVYLRSEINHHIHNLYSS